jgi:type II secretory pathway component PulF
MMQESPGGATAPAKPPRLTFALLVSFIAILLVPISFVTARFQKIYEQLDMKELPLPTELFLAMAQFIRQPAGFIALGVLEFTLILLTVRGTLDRGLKPLIWIGWGVLILLTSVYVLGIYMPIIRMQPALEQR